MRTTCLRFVLPAILLIGSSVRAAAQDVPTVFIHGLASSNATWQGAADRLKARVAIAPQRPNLNWRDKFESQASSLQSALGGLPGSTIAVGHSNGGLVARQWSRLHPVGGIVTLGTPNQGAPLAYNALRWLNYNFTVSHVITEVFNAYRGTAAPGTARSPRYRTGSTTSGTGWAWKRPASRARSASTPRLRCWRKWPAARPPV